MKRPEYLGLLHGGAKNGRVRSPAQLERAIARGHRVDESRERAVELAVERIEAAASTRSVLPDAGPPVLDILTPDELEQLRARDRELAIARHSGDDSDLVDVIEGAIRTRFGSVPVVVEVLLAGMRRGGSR